MAMTQELKKEMSSFDITDFSAYYDEADYNNGEHTAKFIKEFGGELYTLKVKFFYDKTYDTNQGMFRYNSKKMCSETSGKWQKAVRIEPYVRLDPDYVYIEMLKKKNPYLFSFCKEMNGDPLTFLIAPELEQLHKAGFAFAEEFMNACNKKNPYRTHEEYFPWSGGTYEVRRAPKGSEMDYYNRLITHGTPGKLKKLFNVSWKTAQLLKGESDISLWNEIRIMETKRGLSPDEVSFITTMNLSSKHLKQLSSILSRKYKGHPVFTLRSLLNYFERIDMFEAIDVNEGIELLNDYLMMCQVMDVKPKTDSDSLKREHDVMARNLRSYKSRKLEERMEDACENLQKYNYKEKQFFIRGIENYDDLLDEANQQSNCLAGYAQSIALGKSYIYVMRSTHDPDKSLISVEIEPNTKQIVQKYLSHNRPVRNKAQTEFLNRWVKYIRTVA